MDSRELSTPHRGCRVLVAEDDEGMRAFIGDALGAFGFRHVALAEDGLRARSLLEAGLERDGASAFDLVLTDLDMPGMDGRALIRFLRGHLALRRLPCVVVTGSAEEVGPEERAALGVAALVRKPFSLPKFIGTINEVLAAA